MKCEVCDKSFKTTRAAMCHTAAAHSTWLAERLGLKPDVQSESNAKALEKKGFFGGFFDWHGFHTLLDVVEDAE